MLLRDWLSLTATEIECRQAWSNAELAWMLSDLMEKVRAGAFRHVVETLRRELRGY